MIKIKTFEDFYTLSEETASLVISEIKKKPNLVLALPTGITPFLMYQILVQEHKKGAVSFSQITTFNLDEYLGVSVDNPLSYRYYMNKHFFSKIDIDLSRVHIPDGTTKSPQRECEEYENKIKKHGPIDLAVLGIGVNGHIGFNEPGDDPELPTHLVNLSKETIKINKGPEKAITMGISTILKSKKIILLAFGEKKAKAVFEAVKGPISKKNPASFLQKHSDCLFLLDKEAGKLV